MSLSAIQDNLLKTNLVQQTQTKIDDVQRSQDISTAAAVKEQARQEDQVVIHTKQKSNADVADEKKEKQRREQEEEEEKEEREDGPKDDNGPRARMRTINIVI